MRRQNPFEGTASFPVLREFQSPCACGTVTQDVDKVVQCPSCGVCYKVTQKRQLMSLQSGQFSAVSVSPVTKFWCAVWALLGFGFLFGGDLRSAVFLLTMGVWIACVLFRMAFHWLMEKYQEATTKVSVEVIEDSDGQWEVVPAPKPLAQNPNSIGGPQHMESRARATGPDDAAAKFGFSRPAQTPEEWKPNQHKVE